MQWRRRERPIDPPRRRTIRTTALAAVAVTVAAALPWRGDAGAVTPGRFVTGWIPNWSTSVVTDGIRALDAGWEGVFAEVSPFGFSATGAGTIATSGTESNLTRSVNALRARRLPVVPSITDGTGRLVMAGILADPATRIQHVQAITNLVLARGYDGIDLDYEGFAFSDGRSSWDATRPNWAAFVAELGAALHANGKLLSVTVPPIWNGGNSGYWVYAWPEMLPHIDRLRLMVYDWSVSTKGPLAPMTWVDSVLAYVRAVVPADQLRKVQMGVPTYGRSWATVVSGVCPASASLGTVAIQMENMAGVVAASGAAPVRDPSGELLLVYDQTFSGSRTAPIPPPVYLPPANQAAAVAPADPTGLKPALRLDPGGSIVTCTVRRTVYYPDAYSVVQRANAALAAGLSGIAIWALGYETTDIWAPLAGIDVTRPTGTAPIGSLDGATLVGGGVTVTGWAMDPEFDLPMPVTISVTDPGQPTRMSGPIIARAARPDLPGAIPGADPLHGFTAGVPFDGVQPGATVCLHATGWGAAATSTVLGCRTV